MRVGLASLSVGPLQVRYRSSCSLCFLTSGAPPPGLAACRLDVAKGSVWANRHHVSKLFRICCQNLRTRFHTGKSGFLALFENWESGNPPPPPPFPQGQQSAGAGSCPATEKSTLACFSYWCTCFDPLSS